MSFVFNTSEYQKEYESIAQRFLIERIAERIWKKDHTIWSDKKEEITNRLGWLTSVQSSLASLNEINQFVESVRKDGFKKALLLGMGGSSLAPEVFRLTFGVKEGYLDLAVLDSTDPAMVLDYGRLFDPKETLYIVSTKSGGTVETFSFMKYFFNQAVEKVGKENAGKHFVAITDPGSGLETTAKQLKYRKIFLNDPDIGGRYSALSLFGIVPAALIGADVSGILKIAEAMVYSGKAADVSQNPGSETGIVMGVLAKKGIDKVTFITSKELSYFGAWVEQLIAESTGKIGKGILPVVGEEIVLPEFYSNDRLFVYLHIQGDNSNKEKVDPLLKAGQPVIEIVINSIDELGAEFFRWEMATIVSSWIIAIQPFDQPNVESAKIVARRMVSDYINIGKLPELPISAEEAGIKITSSIAGASVKEIINTFLDNMKSNPGVFKPYVSIQAYLTMDKQVENELQIIRTEIQKKYKVATTIGFGPRFLHSTGQLHKGDAGKGLFIQFLYEPSEDAAIPDEAGETKSSISFSVLIKAQALGDRKALLDNQRKVITINTGKDVLGSLQKISKMI